MDQNKIAEVFGLSPEQLNNVIRTVTRKTMNWAKKQSAKGLGDKLKIPYKTVRERTRLKVKTNRGKLWFGLNPIDLKYLNPTITGKGVIAGGEYHSNAFRVRSLNDHIFQRVDRFGIMKSGKYKGQMRQKIEKVDDPIATIAWDYLNIFTGEAGNYFIEQLFEQIDKQSGRNTNMEGITLAQADMAKSIAPKLNQ